MRNDSHLLRAFVDHGSQEAFQQLVESYLPLVYRSALRQLNSDTHRAQDVAQMVFTALAQKARQLTGHPNLAAWLYTTTHRITCRIIRTELRRRSREHAWAADAVADGETSQALWNHLAPLLDDAVRALSARDREAILLRFFSNRSFGEIGDAFSIAEDAARMRVNRALDRLRQQLVRRGRTVTPAALAGFLASDAANGAPAGLVPMITASAVKAAPAATSAAGTLLAIMTGSKFVSTGSAVAAFIAIGFSLHQWDAFRSAAVRLALAQQEAADLRQQLSDLERANTGRETAIKSAESPARQAPVHDPWAAERAKGDAFLARHPEVREALVHLQRARTRGKYLPLYQELNLTPAQIDEFETLMLGAGGRPVPHHGVLYVGENLTPAQRDARLRQLLGENAFDRIAAARSREGGDAVVQQLAARLAVSDEPITVAASIAVRDAIDRARSEVGRGGDIWRASLSRIEAVLTARQMEEMQAIVAQDRYRQAARAGTTTTTASAR